jgi:hypothetical protein
MPVVKRERDLRQVAALRADLYRLLGPALLDRHRDRLATSAAKAKGTEPFGLDFILSMTRLSNSTRNPRRAITPDMIVVRTWSRPPSRASDPSTVETASPLREGRKLLTETAEGFG